jgi:hypothetical protein
MVSIKDYLTTNTIRSLPTELTAAFTRTSEPPTVITFSHAFGRTCVPVLTTSWPIFATSFKPRLLSRAENSGTCCAICLRLFLLSCSSSDSSPSPGMMAKAVPLKRYSCCQPPHTRRVPLRVGLLSSQIIQGRLLLNSLRVQPSAFPGPLRKIMGRTTSHRCWYFVVAVRWPTNIILNFLGFS